MMRRIAVLGMLLAGGIAAVGQAPVAADKSWVERSNRYTQMLLDVQYRHSPEGGSRERLLELKYVIEGLADVYEDEGIEIWLHSRQRSLGGQSPLELLKGGRFAEVLDAIDRLAGGLVRDGARACETETRKREQMK